MVLSKQTQQETTSNKLLYIIFYTAKALASPRRGFCVTKTMAKQNKRADRDGTHRGQFDKNRKKIYATQTVCGICGRPVDFSIRPPEPLSPTIDHIIPISKGGHPSDLANLQLAHRCCNRQKSDKLFGYGQQKQQEEAIKNNDLKGSIDFEALPLESKRKLFCL